MNRRTTTITLAAVLISSVCFAWGLDGHRITGCIAETLLKPSRLVICKFVPRGDNLYGETLRSVSVRA